MMTNLDLRNVWKIVENIRKSFLLMNISPECDWDSETLLSDIYTQINVNSLAEKLKLNTTYTPYENVSEKTLKTAVKMFTYLNYCPPKLLSYFVHSFKTETPKNILLAITVLMKTPQIAVKKSSIRIFKTIMESLSLNEYEKIQIITKRKCYDTNATFGNCKAKFEVNEESEKFSG